MNLANLEKIPSTILGGGARGGGLGLYAGVAPPRDYHGMESMCCGSGVPAASQNHGVHNSKAIIFVMDFDMDLPISRTVPATHEGETREASGQKIRS